MDKVSEANQKVKKDCVNENRILEFNIGKLIQIYKWNAGKYRQDHDYIGEVCCPENCCQGFPEGEIDENKYLLI